MSVLDQEPAEIVKNRLATQRLRSVEKVTLTSAIWFKMVNMIFLIDIFIITVELVIYFPLTVQNGDKLQVEKKNNAFEVILLEGDIYL